MGNDRKRLADAGLIGLVAACCWMAALAGSPARSEGSQSSETEYEPFAELPQDFAEFLVDRGLLDVEFVVIAMPGRIISYKVGEVQENEINEGELQAGEYVVPGLFGFDFAKQAEGFQAVVLSTASPGSGNDCRRGGSCKEVQN